MCTLVGLQSGLPVMNVGVADLVWKADLDSAQERRSGIRQDVGLRFLLEYRFEILPVRRPIIRPKRRSQIRPGRRSRLCGTDEETDIEIYSESECGFDQGSDQNNHFDCFPIRICTLV